jgi:transcriptional regulator with XRE-family HTH domain
VAVTEAGKWAGQELAARREKKKLTQQQLADLAGLDRSTIVKLESGDRRISMHYAEKLAPHLGVKPEKLPPPQEQKPDASNPLVRLAKLEAEVAQLRTERDSALQAVVARLAALEAAPARKEQQSNPRSSGRS